MGFAELLTIVFVVLKLTGFIGWSWWLVLLPTIISVSLYILWFIVWATFMRKGYKRMEKEFDDFDKNFWK